MIRVFPSRLEGEPLETHHTTSPTTVRAWLEENAPLCDASLLTLHLNGEPATLDTEFMPGDTLDIHVEARGPVLIVAAVTLAVAVVMLALMPKPATPRAQRQARGLDSVGIDANTVRFGDPIPEIYGRPARVYPDYLLPPRTYYQDLGVSYTPHPIQWVEALLCVGKGEYEKSLSDVYIGDTRAVALGSDVEMQFHEPGESLEGLSAAEWWHTPTEVGFTSRGDSGQKLGVETGSRPTHVPANSFEVNSDLLMIPGADPATFPEEWSPGVELRIEVPYPATVTSTTITTAEGLSHFTPYVGMEIEISGPDEGVYKIASYTPPSGGSPADPGSASTFTGSAAPSRLDFGVTPGGLTIGYGGTLSVLLSSDYADASELALAIASQINGTGLAATLSGGVIQLVEQQPYTGQPITVSGSAAVDIFGSDPVSVTGDPATPATPGGAASITLLDENDIPVTALTPGLHPIAIGNVGFRYRIVATPNSKTREVEMVGVPSFVGWPPLTSSEIEVSIDPNSLEVGWVGPFAATPPGEKCDAIEIDIVFPSGLNYSKKSGSLRRKDATVEIEWREIGELDWNLETVVFSDSTRDARAYTRRINLPSPAEAEVRVRQTDYDLYYRSTNGCNWSGLRSRIVGAPTRYDGVTLLSVRIRTGDRISAQSDNKVWIKHITRKLPTLEDPDVLAPTRDIMPAVLHMLDTVGYGRSRVDMVASEELHDIWKGRGDMWDYAATSSSTVKTLANHALKAGFAELVVDRGLVKPVRDARRDQPEYIYSPQEFTDYPTLTTQMPEPDEVDGVDAEYVDEQTGRTETIKYRLPTDKGRRAQKISLIGVTRFTQAWRLAARHRRTLAYRRTVFRGQTELHALNSSYMSYDRIQDGVPGYGQSCFVVGLSGNVLRVSEPLEWGADAEHSRVVAFREMDGRLTAPQWVTRGETDYELVLDEPPSVTLHFGGENRDPTMLYFGNVRNWSHDVLVTAIKPGRDNRVTIEAVEYDDRVYADDDRDPSNEVLLTSEVYEASEVTSEVYEASEVTSLVYSQDADDSVSSSVTFPTATLRSLVVEANYEPDSLSSTITLPEATLRTSILEYASDDELAAVVEFPEAALRYAIIRTNADDSLQSGVEFPEALLRHALLKNNYDQDALEATITFPEATLYDPD